MIFAIYTSEKLGCSNSKDFFILKNEEDIDSISDFPTLPLPSAEVSCQLTNDTLVPLDEFLDWGETFHSIETEIKEETAKNAIYDIPDKGILLEKRQKFKDPETSKRKRRKNGKKTVDIDGMYEYL